jgi:hypothetical protein
MLYDEIIFSAIYDVHDNFISTQLEKEQKVLIIMLYIQYPFYKLKGQCKNSSE